MKWLGGGRRFAALTALVTACARIEPPPGGPPDAAAPQLVRTNPDSFQSIPDFSGDVEFFFDEVISEGSSPSQGAGTGDIEKLVLLSPTTEVPEVRWRRDRITVRPDEGWQRDRIYRVELLPGVTDLRRNRSNRGALITFSTGAPRPETTFEGVVVDWRSGRPAPAALVVATQLPDSLPYRGLADSSGRFSLGPLPAGEYIVSGVLDENRNHLADPREAFDSMRVTSRRDSALELWAFVHDTTPPRIRTVTPTDSVSAVVELTQSLDPRQRLQPSAVRVSLLPDSTPVRIASLLPRPLDDSLHAKRSARVDSAGADTSKADTLTPPGRPPVPGARPGARPPELGRVAGRPALSDQLVLRPVQPWRVGGRYTVEIRGVRNVTGVAGDVVGTLVVPERPTRDSLLPGPDSVRAGPDTARPQ
ncbi:MAG: carboxypeptidase regulatory-like domain-containing protein [Gemmatimonadales bacterium]|nr:carboxypeptidase regulatory-like domain-containing protein [Gemmatimonadales bacterium]